MQRVAKCMIMIKPYYQDEWVTLYNGDCREILSEFPDKSIDIILTDPPYGLSWHSGHYVGYNPHKDIANDDKYPVEIITEFQRIAIGALLLFCRWDNLGELPPPKSFIVWNKNNGSGSGNIEHEYNRKWEGIVFYPLENHQFNSRPFDVINCDRTGNKLHPTEKPEELISKLILHNKGDLILDPFLGSGTTCYCAKKLGRKSIGIEIEEKYCEIAAKRCSQSVMKLEV